MTKPRTLYDKVWDSHLVTIDGDGNALIYIDLHLVHEVTTPQAFEGLRLTHRKMHRTDKTIAVPDHNVPSTPDPRPPAVHQGSGKPRAARYPDAERQGLRRAVHPDERHPPGYRPHHRA